MRASENAMSRSMSTATSGSSSSSPRSPPFRSSASTDTQHVPVSPPHSFGPEFDISSYLLTPGLDHLQLTNPHPRDSDIAFAEKQHMYTYQGVPVSYSVTQIVSFFCEDFDQERAVRLMKGSRNWPRPEYSNRDGSPWTDEQVKQFWGGMSEFARNRGTWMHYNIERYFNGLIPAIDTPEMDQFFKFHQEVMQTANIKPYRTEWRICDPVLSLAGSVDFVGVLPDGTYVIVDWKRSKNLGRKGSNNFGKKMKAPLNTLQDSELSKYYLQLNVYRFILQTLYGMTVSRMVLGVFHPTLPKYETLEVPIMEKETEILLNHTVRAKTVPRTGENAYS